MSGATSKDIPPPIPKRRVVAASLQCLAQSCRTPDLLPHVSVTRNTLVVLPSLTAKCDRLTADQQAEAEEYADARFDPILLDRDALAKKVARYREIAKDDGLHEVMDLYRGVPGLSVGGPWLLPSVRITCLDLYPLA